MKPEKVAESARKKILLGLLLDAGISPLLSSSL